MDEVMGVISTSVPEDRLCGQRRELIKHGCEMIDEPEHRVRVKWPKGTMLAPKNNEYTLPDGWTVRLG